MSVSIAEALALGTSVLAEAGVEAPGREARLLLAHALGVSPAGLLDRHKRVDVAAFEPMLARRAAREPFALITGRQGFWTLDLAVSPDTLIPRPDSETLIEAMRAAFAGAAAPRRILDLGTGTGALLLAALMVFPEAWGVGVDRIPAAARLARRNALECGLADRACFVCGHWADALACRFDAVLCNPPYIRSADIAGLMPEVARHEPASALDGGTDGLECYRAVLNALASTLSRHGVAILELGENQHGPVAELAVAAGFDTETSKDLSGIDRAMLLRPRIGEKSFGSLSLAR